MRHARSTSISAVLVTVALAASTLGFATAPRSSAEGDGGAPSVTAPRRSATPAVATLAGADGVERDRGGRASARAVLGQVDDLRAVSAPGEAARTHVDALMGRPPTATPEENDVADSDSDFTPVPASWRFARPVPDLDGDGIDDVLDQSFDADSGEYAIVARRGTDGAELWSLLATDSADVLSEVVPDLTGDGASDLLIWDITFGDYGCEDENCDTWYADFTWSVRVRDGRTGAAAWTTTYPGSYRDAFVYEEGESTWGNTYDYRSEFEADNYWVVPLVADDHDGDGVRDLIVNQIDFIGAEDRQYATYEEPLPIREEGTSRSIDVHATVSLVGGSDGESFWERTAEGADGDAVAVPFGDAVGSGTDELLWLRFGHPTGDASCRYLDVLVVNEQLDCTDTLVEEWTTTAELLDGDARATAWSYTVTDGPEQFTWILPAEADLDGDGSDDLFEIVDSFDFDSWESSTTITPRSGADASALWSAVTEWGFPIAVGSLDGGAGQDVLIADSSFVETEEDWFTRTSLHRLDGATGTELLTTTHDSDDLDGSGGTFTGLFLGQDLDGDGGEDLWLSSYTINFDTGAETSRDLVESLATGEQVYLLESAGDRWVWDLTDLDADGDAEVVQVDLVSTRVRLWDEWTRVPVALDVSAHQHDSGAALWALPRLDYWDDSLATGSDVDGVPGSDLIEARAASDPAGVTLRHGATADVLWTR
ncbi:MAG: hypothetical protein KY469_05465 [Actinobacteria bacterium]|nr:hypothetical protein [Actinomycetota bacterium]